MNEKNKTPLLFPRWKDTPLSKLPSSTEHYFTNISTLATVQQLGLSNSPLADMSSILPATWENRLY